MATIDEYFRVAQREKATDVYFNVGSPPFLKISGSLQGLFEHENLDKSTIDGLAREVLSPEKWSEFKSRGELVCTCRVRDMGHLRIVLANGRKGPCMACRLIPSTIPEFDSLGLPPLLMGMASAEGGLILVMGRAGSGKTTTLASLIGHINNTQEKSIVTIESTMEYVHTQNRSLIERIQPRKSSMLLDENDYSIFLQTANIMVIDGFPFEETISPAITAAAEGLLVLASLETNGGVAEVLARIVDTCPAPHREYRRSLLARVLRGAIWQHLFPLKDTWGFRPAAEIMMNDPVISSLISREGQLHLLRPTMAAGRHKGLQTMHQAIEALKCRSLVEEEILAAFENEMLQYYVSPVKVNS